MKSAIKNFKDRVIGRLNRIKELVLINFSKLIAPIYRNRKSDLILFGSRNGDYYMDNSRALFEWYWENGFLNIIWMTKSSEVYASLKKSHLPVARIDSLKGIILLNKAKFGLYTNRLLDLAISDKAVPKSLKVIFLSHGQSVKNTRFTVKEGVNPIYHRDTLKASQQMAFAVTTSPFMAEVQSKSNGIPPDGYKITGFPRNDWMFNPPKQAADDWFSITKGKQYSKVILYAPTWRMKGDKTRMFPFNDLNIKELAKFIDENNILLLLRPHIQDMVNNEQCSSITEALTELSDNIKLTTTKQFLDANLLLFYIDILISDYSSIYHDFLILDRPIFFIPYDIETFDKVNGFKYPYLENLPGPIISTQNDFMNEIISLINGTDSHTVKRAALRKKLYSHLDNKACERVATEIASFDHRTK